MNIDPNKQYVKITTWGTLMLPIDLVELLEKAVMVDTEYAEGRHVVKLKKDSSLSFTMVPKEEVAAAVAAYKLEG